MKFLIFLFCGITIFGLTGCLPAHTTDDAVTMQPLGSKTMAQWVSHLAATGKPVLIKLPAVANAQKNQTAGEDYLLYLPEVRKLELAPQPVSSDDTFANVDYPTLSVDELSAVRGRLQQEIKSAEDTCRQQRLRLDQVERLWAQKKDTVAYDQQLQRLATPTAGPTIAPQPLQQQQPTGTTSKPKPEPTVPPR